jgi:hypothetical protein
MFLILPTLNTSNPLVVVVVLPFHVVDRSVLPVPKSRAHLALIPPHPKPLPPLPFRAYRSTGDGIAGAEEARGRRGGADRPYMPISLP